MTDFGGTATRLPRYDWNTLQPIRHRHPLLNEDAPGATLNGFRSYSRRPIPVDLYNVPRVSQQWQQPISPLAIEAPVATIPAQEMQGTIRTLKTPYIQPMPENPIQVVTTGAQVNSQPKFSWEERLFENYHIGVHRLVFLVRRFPALAALLTSIWVLFGRKGNANFPIGQVEVNQNIGIFVTTIVTLIGVILGVRNHGNQHKMALGQIVSRLGSLSLSLVGELATFILGIIAIINLAKQKEPTPPDCFPKSCFSLNNRIVQSGIQLGLTLLSIILTLVALFHGVQAIFRILYDRRIERRTMRRNRELASYSNPLVNKTDLYF